MLPVHIVVVVVVVVVYRRMLLSLNLCTWSSWHILLSMVMVLIIVIASCRA